MTQLAQEPGTSLPEQIRKHKRIIVRELKQRSLWFVQLRWWVPPSILGGTVVARLLGVEFRGAATVAVAAFILAYNIVLYMMARELREHPAYRTESIQRFTYWQVALDYGAMFLLIHFTGGAASPLIFFFIFHIIFASILLPPLSAYGFAALAAAGMALIATCEYQGWIPHHALYYRGRAIDLAQRPFHMAVELGFFTASVFITAFATTAIMRMLRKRIVDLADLSDAVTRLNNRFTSLYAMTQAIGSIRDLDKVLDIVTRELATVMDVKAISVKLLSDDGKFLRYAAVHGLPPGFDRNKVVEVAKSPLNRSIIEGEPFAAGHITHGDMFQFGEDLAAARIQSVLFVPMTGDDKVVGILGAYCTIPDRFKEDDVEFFRLAAGLAAIALDNASSYQAIENLIRERSKFMTRVAHNLRAPLAAVLSILEVVREGYYGPLNDNQSEYLRRVDRRARTMLSMINELMALAESRMERTAFDRKPLEVEWLAGRLQRTFQDEALEKGLSFTVTVNRKPPPIWGNTDMIERMLENLVSNAIKYTPYGGKVGVVFSLASDKMVSIEINDNGIGIPRDAMPNLFNEFFRARNAREVEEVGTGLGLSVIKEIVDKHGGAIQVESEEGCGTIFLVRLPAVSEKEGQ